MLNKKFLGYALCCLFGVNLYAKDGSKIEIKIEMSAAIKEELAFQMMTLQAQMQSTVEMVSKGQWTKLKSQGNYVSKLVLAPIKHKTKLPEKFLKYAAELQNAGEGLANAASKNNGGAVLSTYNRILSTCMKCHAGYAPNYFDQTKEYIPPKEYPQKVNKPTRLAPTLLPTDWR